MHFAWPIDFAAYASNLATKFILARPALSSAVCDHKQTCRADTRNRIEDKTGEVRTVKHHQNYGRDEPSPVQTHVKFLGLNNLPSKLTIMIEVVQKSSCATYLARTMIPTRKEPSNCMPRIVHLILKFCNISLNSLRFAVINRDLRPQMVRSCIEYWSLLMRNELAKFFGYAHDPNETVHILGMRLHTFSLQTLCILVNEIFLEREYAFTAHSDVPSIIDCGSNIGISILFFKKLLPRARIIGFEPDRKTFELLSRNVSENGLSEVSLHNLAVSSNTGEVPFFSDSRSPGSLIMSTVRERIAGDPRQVPCIVLSEFIKGSMVDMLKMDIEGAEMDVMLELQASGVLHNINAIAMEFHHHLKPEEEQFSEMLRLLDENSFGYDVASALPGSPGGFQDIRLRIYRKDN